MADRSNLFGLSKDFQSLMISGALHTLEFMMRILPRWLVDFLVEGIFPFVWFFTKELQQICIRNLRSVDHQAKDIKEYQRVTRQYMKSIGFAMMDLLYYFYRPQKLAKIVDIAHEDNLKKALEAGKGVIAVSAHLGNFPLMFISLVQRGYKVNVIIRTMRDKNFSKFMYRLCGAWGINMIQTSPAKQFLKDSLGALKRNELLFILLDEVVAADKGVKVKFFDRDVIRAVGPVLFFERTAAPVVPMFIVKDDKKHFKICVETPFVIDRTGSVEENRVRNIAGLTRIVERFVTQYPFQWGGWFNKRWSLGIN